MYKETRYLHILAFNLKGLNSVRVELAVPFTYSVIQVEMYGMDTETALKYSNDPTKIHLKFRFKWTWDVYSLRVSGWFKDLKCFYPSSRWTIYKEVTRRFYDKIRAQKA